jgi:hypothetical protein
MANEPGSPFPTGDNGSPRLAAATPSWRWVLGWVLLITAAFPAALLAASPIAAALLGLIDIGVKAGFWASYRGDLLIGMGFIISYALLVATIQSYLMRNYLPRPGWMFAATGAGLILGGLIAGLGIAWVSAANWDPAWGRVILFLPVGLILGFAQWLYLRRFLPNALWIILIDALAAVSFLLTGPTITSLLELAEILFLPGIITGVGLWLLLMQPRDSLLPLPPAKVPQEKIRKLPRLARIGLGLAAAVPLFFLFIYVYAVSQLALAKNNGVYPTVEDAIVAMNSRGWGDAKVLKIENVHAGPNQRDGSQPYLWFGGAEVYLDRVPQGGNRTQYSSGSYYMHVSEGWILLPEGSFPEFIGRVMELYGLEGVGR